MSAQTCPCCDGVLLRHARSSGSYWLCKSCRQEMPVLTEDFPLSDALLSSGEDEGLSLENVALVRSAK